MPDDRIPRGASTRLRSLSAVLPAFNEEGNIRHVLTGVLRALSRVTDDLEVVVVDDGSTDRTVAVLEAIARNEPSVVIVRHARNRGYGAALRSGFQRATREFVFYTDADGQFDPSEISKLIALVSEAQVISGYRERRQDPVHRRVNGWLYSALIRRVLGLPVRDVNCAFKLYRVRDLRALDLRSNGAFIDAEILSKLHRSGRVIRQVGVRHYPRGRGRPSGDDIRVVARTVWESARQWPELRHPLAGPGESPPASSHVIMDIVSEGPPPRDGWHEPDPW